MVRTQVNRRGFLRVSGGCTGAALLGCAGCGEGGVADPTEKIAAGNVSDLAPNAMRVIDGPVVIGRDDAGIFAMSAICPHAGCPVTTAGPKESDGLVCNCHGSRFDAQGAVTRGPARDPLRHYAVDIDLAGAITVRADLPAVVASTRTPVT